ncbi:hypothetical protein H8E88_12305 [candidate division KSB1 bacterium]|nr:hypothetical protein [candidate division KSB1 bacterium]
MIKLTKNKLFIFFITLVLLISFTACEKNPTDPDEDQAPPLPPIESMQAEVAFFSNPPGQSLEKTNLSKNNFFAAGGRVIIINAVVLTASIVPTAIFLAALSQPPELQADGKFHWIYSVQQGGHTYSADLAGSIDVPNSEVIWEMYITCTSYSPPLDNFLWYEGRAKIGNKEGWWIFHHDQYHDSLVDVLKIDWQVPDSTHQNLKISNVYTTHNDFGDNLEYQIENESGFLIYYDASESQTNTIHWDGDTGTGYIQWFDYKDGVKSCWDENQDDSDCTPL